MALLAYFGIPGLPQMLIILVIVVLVFGGARIAGVGKASGRAIREFKEELKGDDPDTGSTSSMNAEETPGQAKTK